MPFNNLPSDQLSGAGNAYANTLQGQFDSQNVQSESLQNQTTAAQLPGVVGNSQSLAAKGQLDASNLPNAIAEAKSNTLAKMSDNDAKMMTNMGGQISQFGAILNNIPAPARGAALTQFASKFNMDANSPLIKGLLEADPDKLPDVVKSMGGSMIQLSQDYVKQSGLVGQKVAGQVTVAQTRADALRDSANIRELGQLDIANVNNMSKENLAKFVANTKQQLQDTKAVSTDQLLAKRTQQYQENPNDQTKMALDQATKIKQAVTQFPALAAQFQQASTAQNILGDTMAPNTVPAPNQSPVSSFPTTNTPTGNIPAAPDTAPSAATKSVQVGTQKGKPVYTSDPTNPTDKSKWHY